MTTRKKASRKGVGGRPRKQFDLQQVEGLGSILATQEEMAAVLGCSVDTIQDRIKHDEEFSGALKRGQAGAKVTLRQVQRRVAVGSQAVFDDHGNVIQAEREPHPTMLIWLGKQWLGQRDKRDVVTREDHQEFQDQYLRAGAELIRAVRRGDDTDRAIQTFIDTVRGGEEPSTPEPNEAAEDGSTTAVN